MHFAAEKGKMTAIEYTIYEQPQPPALDCPVLETPTADKPTIVWDFHSLLLGVQMMFSFMLTDSENPIKPVSYTHLPTRQHIFLPALSAASNFPP